MRIKSLIQEEVYSKLLLNFDNIADRRGYEIVEPTPIVAPFWNSTFTPSSSEVIFRHLDRSGSIQPATTLQPCIRINDLPRLIDGWHFLLFHMISFIRFDLQYYEDEINALLLAMSSMLDCEISDFFYTVATSPTLEGITEKPTLGGDLLLELGIHESNIIYCSGAANYQNSTLRTADHGIIAMTGPKIEVYVRSSDGVLREVATFEIATARIGTSIQRSIFAFVIGLERLAASAEDQINLARMPNHERVITNLSRELLHPSMAQSTIGFDALSQATLILDALAHISSQFDSREASRNRGIANHFRRSAAELSRVLRGIGVSYNEFASAFKQQCPSEDRVVLPEVLVESLNNSLDYEG